jgi:hypothetical protein
VPAGPSPEPALLKQMQMALLNPKNRHYAKELGRMIAKCRQAMVCLFE